MAKKRSGFRKYLRGVVDHEMSLGTLGPKVVIDSQIDGVVNERTWLSSVKLRWSLSNLTVAAGRGPILVGVSHSDYTGSEIEAWVENGGSWNEGGLVEQEISKRKIRMVGVFESELPEGGTIFTLNDGMAVTTKCGWIILQAQGINVWAYNMGSVALATTDPVVAAFGHANLWPR